MVSQRMLRVYVAGPFSGDQGANTHQALRIGDALRGLQLGIHPVVPHRSILAHIVRPRPYEEWMQECESDVQSCDALLRLTGDSPGADREVDWALSLDLPVFRSVGAVLRWAKARREGVPS